MGLFSAAKGVITPDWNPAYDTMRDDSVNNAQRWTGLGKRNDIIKNTNPFWDQQDNNANIAQQQAAAQQQKVYDLMSAIANGTQATQAQNAITQGYQDQVNGMNSLAKAAGGGARGGAAAIGNVNTQAGAQQAASQGMLQAQQAQDQLNAQRMMMGLSGEMRDQDMGALDLTNRRNYNAQQFNVDSRGLNDSMRLELLRLLQNQKFGDMGFESDRGRMTDDAWWRQQQNQRRNEQGWIGAIQGAAQYGGKAIAADQQRMDNDPNYESDERVKQNISKPPAVRVTEDRPDLSKRTTKKDRDEKIDTNWRRWETLKQLADGTSIENSYPNHPYVVSDDRVKEEVRKQAYEEGLSDARHGYTGIEDLLKNADAKKANAKPQLPVLVPVPHPVPTSTRELLGSLSLPPGYVPPPPPPAKPQIDESMYPPEFVAMLKSLRAQSPLVDKPTPQQLMDMPPQFQGVMGAMNGGQSVDPSVDRFSSDEDQKNAKEPNEEDEFLKALAKGRASYSYKARQFEPNQNGEPGGRYLGVMAQDLERVPNVGRQLVNDTPMGKQVHVPSLVSALAAGTGSLYDQQRALEERMARLERKR